MSYAYMYDCMIWWHWAQSVGFNRSTSITNTRSMNSGQMEERQLSCGIKTTFTLPDGTTTVQEFWLSSDDNVDISSSSSSSNNNNMNNNNNNMNNKNCKDQSSASQQVAYTGRHDHGPLPPPRQGGPYEKLIGCVHAAKEFSNAFLTNVMKQETSRKIDHDPEDTTTTTATATGRATKKHKPN